MPPPTGCGPRPRQLPEPDRTVSPWDYKRLPVEEGHTPPREVFYAAPAPRPSTDRAKGKGAAKRARVLESSSSDELL